MKYLATIEFGQESSSKSFDNHKEAQMWLDTQNNNGMYKTRIDIMNDKWIVMDSYIYTEGAGE